MLSSLNRKAFFDVIRDELGRLSSAKVAALNFLLDSLAADPHLTDVRQMAYVLGTAEWETDHTCEPIDEHGSDAYFNRRYGPGTRVGKVLGNTEPGDGARFHGRGFPQTTGRANYERASVLTGVDLLTHPERMKEPAIAYAVMSDAMRKGWYTGRKLDDYIKDRKRDYVNARRIINGTDQAARIAKLAESYEAALRAATGTSAVPPGAGADAADDVAAGRGPEQRASGTPAATDTAAPLIGSAETVVNTAPAPPTGDAPDVPAVKANRQSLITKVGAWATGTTGVGWVLDQIGKVPHFSISDDVLKLLIAGAILFGIVGAIAAIADHIQTKRIAADPGLRNTK